MKNIELSPNTLSLVLGGVLLFLVMGGGNKGCSLPSPTATPASAPAIGRIVPSPAMLGYCAPLKAAAASADPAKRIRLADAFADLAFTLSVAGDNIKTTGTLSDVIQSFGDAVAAAEPDLRASVPINSSLTAARDAAFASLPGSGVDRQITKAQAADFVAAIAESLR